MEERNNLIEILHLLKSEGSELGIETQRQVAEKLSLPLSAVAGVASFYSDFNGMSDGEVDLSFAEGGVEGEMFADDGYGLLKLSREEIMSGISTSGLGGCGGSGYPVAKKWALVAAQDSDTKYIVCNCSEGEGETYKDLKLMLKAPHAMIEGILLCAKAVGAEKAVIYVRSEYTEAKASVEKALAETNKLGVTEGVSIEVFGGAGAYVCGEETALLRSLEGYRGEPALKPPYPGVKGYKGKPTVINNAESFAAAAAYLRSGKLSKLYTVSGCVERSGVYELPYGASVSDIAELAGLSSAACGFRLGGGTTGTILGMDKLDLKLSFEECAAQGAALGTGSIRFFDSPSEALELAAESAAFLASQSCGKCAPCRFGTAELSALTEKLSKGSGSKEEAAAALKLCDYLKKNSRCALGQAAGNVVRSLLDNFPGHFVDEKM